MSDKKKTITEADVQETAHVSRRSVFKFVAGTIAGGAAVLVGANALAAKPTNIRGCTDNDTGDHSDQPGNGRGNGRSDNDQGDHADPPGCGHRR